MDNLAETIPTEKAALDPLVVFPTEQAKPALCSALRCGRGHEWPLTIAAVKCPECSSAVLAIRMENCPVCNEPSEVVRLRTDHMPQGASVAAACKGQHGLAEVAIIDMEKTHWQETEQQQQTQPAEK